MGRMMDDRNQVDQLTMQCYVEARWIDAEVDRIRDRIARFKLKPCPDQWGRWLR